MRRSALLPPSLGAAWVTGQDAVVVGSTGSDGSFDGGRSWQRFDDGSFDTVDC